jgi:uncharacterized OB-fold protein
MKRFVAGVVAAGFVMAAGMAMAQTKTVTGETKLVTATVEAIEASTRTVTLKKDDGTFVTTVVPETMQAFSTLKIGDKVQARYYENLVVRVKKPGEKDTDTAQAAQTPAAAGGTRAKQRTITATITAIDEKTPSITFSGPNGWKYSSRVEDKKALAQVKVGDKVDITWTEALLVSIEPPKK